MTFLTQQKELQASFYAQLTQDSSKTGSLPSTKFLLRHVKSVHDTATQFLNEFGTTDTAIGDATAEIMITTLGKIPNEMYYLEDTTPSGRATELHTALNNFSVETTLVPVGTDKFDGYTGYSMLLSILLSVLLIILLLCCITACIIARSKSKHSFFAKNDIECSPGCSGVNVPLLGLEKTSSTTTKTSSMK